MEQYKFINQVTLDGTWNDGHVPPPSRTFNIGDVINGTCVPASGYPVSRRASVPFYLPNGETYWVEAFNLDGDCKNQSNVNNEYNPNSNSFFTTKNIIIGIIGIIAILGILKLFK